MNCPYCETPTVHIVHDPREHGHDNWAACCYNCGLQAPIRKTEDEARLVFSSLAASARLARAIEAERALLTSGDERAISQYISRLAKAIDPAIEMRIAIGRGPWDDQILQLMTAPAEFRAAALKNKGEPDA